MKKCTRNDVGNRIIRVSAESNAPLTVFVSLSFEERLSKALPCLGQVPARAGGAGGRGNSGPRLGSALGVPVFPLCSPACWALILLNCLTICLLHSPGSGDWRRLSQSESECGFVSPCARHVLNRVVWALLCVPFRLFAAGVSEVIKFPVSKISSILGYNLISMHSLVIATLFLHLFPFGDTHEDWNLSLNQRYSLLHCSLVSSIKTVGLGCRVWLLS